MLDKRQFVIGLLLFLLVAGLAGGLATMWPRLGGEPAAAQGANAMAVDAVPGGGVDSSRTVTGTSPFEVDIRITAAGEPYAGWQAIVRYDTSVLAFVPVGNRNVTYLYDPDSMFHAAATDGSVEGGIRQVSFGSISVPDPLASPLASVRFQCVADGTSALHLTTAADQPAWFSSMKSSVGENIDTDLSDAQVTCEGAGGPAATATPGGVPTPMPTPGGPVATPTPLPPPPPGFEAVLLAADVCQFEAWTGENGTSPGELASMVRPPENLEALWAQQPAPTWRGYSPQFPQASDMGPVDQLNVVAICMKGTGDFVRPMV